MIWLKSRRRRKSSPIAGRGTRWRFKALSSPSRDTPRPYPAPCARRRPAGQTVSADIPPSTSGASPWAKSPCARTTASPAPASARRCQTGRADTCRTHFCRRSPPAFSPPDGKTAPRSPSSARCGFRIPSSVRPQTARPARWRTVSRHADHRRFGAVPGAAGCIIHISKTSRAACAARDASGVFLNRIRPRNRREFRC